MGPTILLDKSTLQSLGKDAIHELTRYFRVTIPPTLLCEILADLEKTERKQGSPSEEVLVLARKVSSLARVAKVNLDFRSICVNELLGHPAGVPMDGCPIPGGVRDVRTSDGRRGVYLPPQPEMDAVLRWGSGRFSESERTLAAQWRAQVNSFDPDSFRRSLAPLAKTADSLAEVNRDVERVLNDDEGRELFLRMLIRHSCPEPARDAVAEWTFRRWKERSHAELAEFAPYCRHCLKAMLLFHSAYVNQLVKTTRSSWIDVEYLYYLPFAEVFSSGDQLHETLAPFLLRKDQSFQPRDDLVADLRLVAEQRKNSKDGGLAHSVQGHRIEPAPGSCIRRLWERHRGGFPTESEPTLSPEDERRIMDEVRPRVEAMERDSKQVRERVWPQ